MHHPQALSRCRPTSIAALRTAIHNLINGYKATVNRDNRAWVRRILTRSVYSRYTSQHPTRTLPRCLMPLMWAYYEARRFERNQLGWLHTTYTAIARWVQLLTAHDHRARLSLPWPESADARLRLTSRSAACGRSTLPPPQLSFRYVSVKACLTRP